jgi:Tfp pilus assembly protein PilO
LALFVIALVVCFFIAGYNHQLATKQKELGELADEILKDTDEKEQLIVLLEKTVQKVKLKEQTEEIRHRLMLLQEILGKLKSPYKKEQDHGVEMARLFRNQMYE